MQPLTNVFEPSLSYRRARRNDRTITRFIAIALGLATAYWIAAKWLPRVEIHADDKGSWTRVEIDWTRTLLGGER